VADTKHTTNTAVRPTWVAAYLKQVRPDIKIIDVQTLDLDAMARSLKACNRVTLSDVGLLSDGTAVQRVGKQTLRPAQR
jgi:threonine dehydratase